MPTLKAMLRDLAIITWAVPRSKVEPLLPPELVPITVDPDRETALVSIATLHDRTLWTEYAQVNERTYVTRRDGTGAGAYFWRSQAATHQATLFRCLLGVPLFRADLSLVVDGDDYRFSLDDREIAHLRLVAPASPAALPGVAPQRLLEIAANPDLGYTLDRGGLHVTRVVHTQMVPREVAITAVDGSWMLANGATEGASPFVAWYVPTTPFDIELPPRRVSEPRSRGGAGAHAHHASRALRGPSAPREPAV